MDKILEVKDLQVSFYTPRGRIQAVRGVSFHLSLGETIAIVGESGCGKSVAAQAIMGLINDPPGRIEGGEILFQGRDLTALPEREMVKIRGREMGMIFQDPMTSLNPVMAIGKQITEGPLFSGMLSRGEAHQRAIEMLKLVGLNYPEKRVNQYPHELSGGMRQRVMIAMALAGKPKIIIADEPTTALDVTVEAQIMDLINEIKKNTGTSIILITHDLSLAAGKVSRIIVMYGGKIMESGTVRDIFYRPRHPYTKGLLQSIPPMDRERDQRLKSIPGKPPDLLNPPTGCAFFSRCAYGADICRKMPPDLIEIGPNHSTACWLEYSSGSSGEEGEAVGT